MTYNKTYIQGLIIEKIAGAITEDDDHILRHAIHNDPEVAKLWPKMQGVLSSDKAQSFFENIDEDQAWDKIKRQLGRVNPINTTQPGITKWGAIAAFLRDRFRLFIFVIIGRR